MFFLAVLFSCGVQQVPDIEISFTEARLDRERGLVYHLEEPYSGFVRRLSSDGSVREVSGYLNGKRHGKRMHYFPGGQPSQELNYIHGRREGLTRSWWSDGTLRAEGNFVHGKGEGVQKQWYRSGALFKEIRLKKGKEEGMQRAWRENGAIYNNYEAKNGRIFGLRRSKLCFELSDEELASDDVVSGGSDAQ